MLDVKETLVSILNMLSLFFPSFPYLLSLPAGLLFPDFYAPINVPKTFRYSCVSDTHQSVWVSSPEGTFHWRHQCL